MSPCHLRVWQRAAQPSPAAQCSSAAQLPVPVQVCCVSASPWGLWAACHGRVHPAQLVHHVRLDGLPLFAAACGIAAGCSSPSLRSCLLYLSLCQTMLSISSSASHIAAGYGYYRSNLTLFDPGWHGEQPKGPEDAGTVDLGNDPVGVLDRQVAMAAWAEPCLNVSLTGHCQTAVWWTDCCCAGQWPAYSADWSEHSRRTPRHAMQLAMRCWTMSQQRTSGRAMHLPAVVSQLLVECHTMTIRSSGRPSTCSIGWEYCSSSTVLEDRRSWFDSFDCNFVALPQAAFRRLLILTVCFHYIQV